MMGLRTFSTVGLQPVCLRAEIVIIWNFWKKNLILKWLGHFGNAFLLARKYMKSLNGLIPHVHWCQPIRTKHTLNTINHHWLSVNISMLRDSLINHYPRFGSFSFSNVAVWTGEYPLHVAPVPHFLPLVFCTDREKGAYCFFVDTRRCWKADAAQTDGLSWKQFRNCSSSGTTLASIFHGCLARCILRKDHSLFWNRIFWMLEEKAVSGDMKPCTVTPPPKQPFPPRYLNCCSLEIRCNQCSL